MKDILMIRGEQQYDENISPDIYNTFEKKKEANNIFSVVPLRGCIYVCLETDIH